MSARVMIAGVGGASLGTEIFKSLDLAGGYHVYGCDISPTAFGLHHPGFVRTYQIQVDDYVHQVIGACRDAGAEWLIPGGEQPMALLSTSTHRLNEAEITLLGNAPEIVNRFSDKSDAFNRLTACGIPVPRTNVVKCAEDVEAVGLPCIIKPATGSGGSVSVFFAVAAEEAMIYAEYISRTGHLPLAQEYVDIDEGEFTVGVLSLPDTRIVGSIALRRELASKISVAYRGRGGIISSGYSQGYIDYYPDVCRQAEHIARMIDSCGPINIQGRLRDGVLLPFEINPRFSASTYLRAMAGFNEVDMLLTFLRNGSVPERPVIRRGWYLRSLTEQFVPDDRVK